MKLNPTNVRSIKAAATTAATEGRKRAVVAINDEGKLVVCCRRTAKNNGWDLQEVLYQRSAKKPVEPAPKPAKVKKAEATVDEILAK